MADVANLQVVVGAKVDQAVTGLDQVSKGLAQTAVQAAKTDSALQKTSKATNTAGNALQNLGRVAQDAPFGFIGIQNNLNPLLESFQRLKAETGSTGTAFKALASSMLGPGGLGFALSIISFVLLKYPDLFSGLSSAALKAAQAQKDVTDAFAASLAPMQSELTKLSALVQVARDSSESQLARTSAIKELQREYPDYLKNISQENINTDATTQAIDRLVGALERKAKAQAFSNLLTKAQEDLIKLQNAPLTEQIGFLEGLKAGYFGLGSTVPSALRAVKTATDNQSKALAEQQALVDNLSHQFGLLTQQQAEGGDFIKPGQTEKINQVAEVLRKLAIDRKQLADNPLIPSLEIPVKEIGLIENAIGRLLELKVPEDSTIIQKLIGDIGIGKGIANDPATLLQQVIINSIRQFNKNIKETPLEIPFEVKIPEPTILKESTQRAINKAQAAIAAARFNIALPVNFDFINNSEAESLASLSKLATDLADKGFKLPENFFTLKDQDRDKLVNFYDEIAGLNNQLANDTFIKIGENLGNLESPFEGIFEIIGSGLQQLGKSLIATSALVASIKKVLNAAFGGSAGAGIALGVGLIAAGALLKKLPKFAEGGIVTSATLGVFGEAGPEAVMPLDKLKDFIPQGNGVQVFIPEMRIRGNDQVISFKRAETAFKRKT